MFFAYSHVRRECVKIGFVRNYSVISFRYGCHGSQFLFGKLFAPQIQIPCKRTGGAVIFHHISVPAVIVVCANRRGVSDVVGVGSVFVCGIEQTLVGRVVSEFVIDKVEFQKVVFHRNAEFGKINRRIDFVSVILVCLSITGIYRSRFDRKDNFGNNTLHFERDEVVPSVRFYRETVGIGVNLYNFFSVSSQCSEFSLILRQKSDKLTALFVFGSVISHGYASGNIGTVAIGQYLGGFCSDGTENFACRSVEIFVGCFESGFFVEYNVVSESYFTVFVENDGICKAVILYGFQYRVRYRHHIEYVVHGKELHGTFFVIGIAVHYVPDHEFKYVYVVGKQCLFVYGGVVLKVGFVFIESVSLKFGKTCSGIFTFGISKRRIHNRFFVNVGYFIVSFPRTGALINVQFFVTGKIYRSAVFGRSDLFGQIRQICVLRRKHNPHQALYEIAVDRNVGSSGIVVSEIYDVNDVFVLVVKIFERRGQFSEFSCHGGVESCRFVSARSCEISVEFGFDFRVAHGSIELVPNVGFHQFVTESLEFFAIIENARNIVVFGKRSRVTVRSLQRCVAVYLDHQIFVGQHVNLTFGYFREPVAHSLEGFCRFRFGSVDPLVYFGDFFHAGNIVILVKFTSLGKLSPDFVGINQPLLARFAIPTVDGFLQRLESIGNFRLLVIVGGRKFHRDKHRYGRTYIDDERRIDGGIYHRFDVFYEFFHIRAEELLKKSENGSVNEFDAYSLNNVAYYVDGSVDFIVDVGKTRYRLVGKFRFVFQNLCISILGGLGRVLVGKQSEKIQKSSYLDFTEIEVAAAYTFGVDIRVSSDIGKTEKKSLSALSVVGKEFNLTLQIFQYGLDVDGKSYIDVKGGIYRFEEFDNRVYGRGDTDGGKVEIALILHKLQQSAQSVNAFFVGYVKHHLRVEIQRIHTVDTFVVFGVGQIYVGLGKSYVKSSYADTYTQNRIDFGGTRSDIFAHCKAESEFQTVDAFADGIAFRVNLNGSVGEYVESAETEYSEQRGYSRFLDDKEQTFAVNLSVHS